MTRDDAARAALARFAEAQDGCFTADDAARFGVSPTMLVRDVRPDRVVRGRRHFQILGAPTTERSRWRWAVANAPASAGLDGVTSLRVHGLQHFTEPTVHLGGPNGTRMPTRSWVRMHQVRLWST